jgi:hypothetical protein
VNVATQNTVVDWARGTLADLKEKFPKVKINARTIGDLELWADQEQNAGTWAADQNNVLGVRNSPTDTVEPYTSFKAGERGTASALENGLYQPIIDDFEDNASTTQFASDVVDSPWSGGTYAQRGLAAFLAHSPLKASASPIAGSVSAGAAPAAASSSKGAASTSGSSTSATDTSLAGSLLGGAAGAVWSSVEPFLAKTVFAVAGLALMGAGVWKLSSNVRHTAVDTATSLGEIGAAA